jgi:hypothetical protein
MIDTFALRLGQGLGEALSPLEGVVGVGFPI